MKPRSKKAIVLLVIVSGVVVLVAAGFAFKRPLLEQWYVWQVESGGEEQKEVALEKLEEMGSVKAVPHFLELILDAQVSATSSTNLSVFSAFSTLFSCGTASTPIRSSTALILFNVPSPCKIASTPVRLCAIARESRPGIK